MKIKVLGLGPSLSTYRPRKGDITIGVNDIWKKHKTDMVVCVDTPDRFPKHRRPFIENCMPNEFFSHLSLWKPYHKNMTLLELNPCRGDVSTLFNGKCPHSTNSAFVAVCVAIQKGAKEVIMYGVDFADHKTLGTPSQLRTIKEHFNRLEKFARQNGVHIFVSSTDSSLFPEIPLYALQKDTQV